ncbi:hypothetical protein SDRG_14519 [Saprolegnia diclina VS20]|uniref:FYVE-type domain-containing protein n=1 Tax=Saprolegnia diclina (strain VS20) TaxID=1156394 RepID=T0Q2P7_SAPDV|nr:hypothetical protein SDRG_14519 [Saprolegnia diclina VS20]EQC27680.1 hypothetical protein SDRG_14519 [Saprolegnia diclina VS20]|eukprot:XP_008618875.1 hypothetical protein SDRG_14519 [Saprolegnia diclina VS20]
MRRTTTSSSQVCTDEPLPLIEAATIKLDCRAAAQDLLNYYDDFCSAPASWRLLRNERGVQMLQGPGRHMRHAYRFATTVTASLDEVKALNTNLTPTEMRDTMDKYADGILDMQVLHRLQTPTVAEPNLQVLVRWVVNACPSPLLHRDFCLAEVQNGWTLPSGQSAWGLAQHSIKVPSCPDLLSTKRYQRGQVHHFGLLYVEHATRPGVLVLFMHLELNVKGWTPSWLYPRLMARQARSVSKLSRLFTSMHGKAKSSTRAAPTPKHCQYCTRQFGLFRPKVRCSNCSEVFCGACALPFEKRHICVECLAEEDDPILDVQSGSTWSGTSPHGVQSWLDMRSEQQLRQLSKWARSSRGNEERSNVPSDRNLRRAPSCST